MLEKDTSDKPDLFLDSQYATGESVEPRAAQLRSLMSVDDMVSKLASELDCLRETRDTLAIFTSDNGYLWGEHGLRRKGTPYLESARVPLLVRWTEEGQPPVDRRLVANIDLAPTIAEVARVAPDSIRYMDGQSLATETLRHRLLLEYWPNVREQIPRWNALRTTKYHYVEYERDGEVIARELYDLARDPWELTNLLGDGDPANNPSAARLDALARTLRAFVACRSASCR